MLKRFDEVVDTCIKYINSGIVAEIISVKTVEVWECGRASMS